MKLIFLILFLITNSFAIAIDKSWYEDTNENLTKIYDEQAKRISLIKNNAVNEEKEQIDYQLLLLKKLQTLIKQDDTFSFPETIEIDSIDSYIKKVKEYIKIDSEYINKQNEFNDTSKKIEALTEQISKFTDKNEVQAINAQLLFAFYTLKNKTNKTAIDAYAEYQKRFKKRLLESIDSLKIQENEELITKIQKAQSNYEQILKDEKKILLALDKAIISENANKIESLNSNIIELQNEKNKIVDNIIYLKIEELLPYLKNKKSQYFDLSKNLQSFNTENGSNYDSLVELFKYLSRERIGVAKSTFADTKESFLDILRYSWTEINNPIIPIGDGVSILAVIKFFLIFIFGFTIAIFYKRKISNASGYLKNSSPATKTMLANLGYYFLVILTFVFALNSVGIDLSSLTILVGALSVGIGFGLQNIVSNFISGIILIFEKSIQVGNIIEISDQFRGRVTQINMRSSVINTFDNIDIIIPNSTLMQNNVINLTFSDDIRRLHVPFGVAYGTSSDLVIEVILNALAESDLIYIKDDESKIPKVWMTGMGASSVDFKLLVWINANTNKAGVDSSNMSDFLIFIYKTLQKNNIEIPFPQLDLNIKKPLTEIL
ncbi:mechanosensitive ion channel domain-containing protein [Arcobacter sp. s6]|uniref:mechanosensitive ion channel domain-containing protein n=1 Tax=Arcobacter sp. s6 TaxID=3230363 RepID=UPI0034A06461